MTGVSAGKEGIIEGGAGDRTRLCRLCRAYEDLQGRWTKEKHRKRYKMKRAGRRLQERIRNLVHEVHCKLVKWLVTHFDVVLLPKFETQSMCQKTQRSEEHTSELMSLMRISYAVFCLQTNTYTQDMRTRYPTANQKRE